jgi:cytochrome c oxidase subunit 2
MTAPAPSAGGGGGARGGPLTEAAAKRLFVAGNPSTSATACGSCHTLGDAGTSGQVGPNLDKGLKGKTPAYIKQSIEKPNAVITPGYRPNIMPPNYAQLLSTAQLDALVAYLAKVTK